MFVLVLALFSFIVIIFFFIYLLVGTVVHVLLIIIYLKYMYVMLTNVLALLIRRIEISSESRLKKLRDGANETVVTGKKFTQKLKRQ